MTDRSVMKGDTEADRESVWWRYVRIGTDKDRMEDSSREIEREMLAQRKCKDGKGEYTEEQKMINIGRNEMPDRSCIYMCFFI